MRWTGFVFNIQAVERGKSAELSKQTPSSMCWGIILSQSVLVDDACAVFRSDHVPYRSSSVLHVESTSGEERTMFCGGD